MMFHKTELNDKEITKFFKKKCALVASDSVTSRTSIRKCLITLGVDPSDIRLTPSLDAAHEAITKHNPQIIFAHDIIKGEKSEELLDRHMELFANRQEASFFLISDDNNAANIYLMLEKEIEAIITTPFTNKYLEETIITALEKKIKPSSYFVELENAKEQIFLGKDEPALEILDKAISLSEKNIAAQYYKAALLIKKNEDEEGEKLLQDNKKREKSHYKTLNKLRILYKKQKRYEEQYNTEMEILKDYPLNPIYLPELTNLCIRNKKFEDILEFIEVAKELKDEDTVVTTHVAAGLALCARNFVSQNKIDDAKNITEQAGTLCKGKIGVLEHCTETLIQAKAQDNAIEFLEKFKTSETDLDEYSLLLFKTKISGEDATVIYNKGMDFIKEGLTHPHIFTTIINSMVETGKSYESVEELATSAIKMYPELKDDLGKRLEEYKKNSQAA